ncbi:MAG: hypothetical protein ABI539_06580 [Acidobacteriota bacterium]
MRLSVHGDGRVDQWNKYFYKPKTTYKLVFGGAFAGTAVVTGSSPTEECIRNLARIDLSSTRAKLKGKVMAIATDLLVPRSGAGLRRRPTATERSAVEDLVKKELATQKVPVAGTRNLKYHNLTAVDIDNDGTVELIGSFWAPISATERALLFVVAEKGDKEGYVLSYKDLKDVKESDTMSGDISNVDDGVYNELLLDILDVDGDGKSEIFTYSQSFEGAGFNVYSKKDRSWVKVFEGWNYHCGY